eukprot:snap_masked-scaffold_1-processed-gene-26.25-mRNA-1 protein AED:1.00 eAED:1.00 QI:0/0/0/0/1/1/3/0/381
MKQVNKDNHLRYIWSRSALMQTSLSVNPILTLLPNLMNQGKMALSRTTRQSTDRSSLLGSFGSEITESPESVRFPVGYELAQYIALNQSWADCPSFTVPDQDRYRADQFQKVVEKLVLARNRASTPKIRLNVLINSFSYISKISNEKELCSQLTSAIFSVPKEHELYIERCVAILVENGALLNSGTDNNGEARESKTKAFAKYKLADPLDEKFRVIESILATPCFKLASRGDFSLLLMELYCLMLEFERVLIAQYMLSHLEPIAGSCECLDPGKTTQLEIASFYKRIQNNFLLFHPPVIREQKLVLLLQFLKRNHLANKALMSIQRLPELIKGAGNERPFKRDKTTRDRTLIKKKSVRRISLVGRTMRAFRKSMENSHEIS